jgi:hypothetical protein
MTLELDVTLALPVPPPPGTTTCSTFAESGGDVPFIYASQPCAITTKACPGGTASWTLTGRGDGQQPADFAGTMTEGPAGTYSGILPAVNTGQAHGVLTVTVTIDCPDGSKPVVSFAAYFDPSGTVFDQNGTPVTNATVTLLRSDSPGGPFTAVPSGSTIMSAANRDNPDATDGQGQYGWDVQAGFYEVQASKSGCTNPADGSTTVTSPVLTVAPAVAGVTLTLNCPGAQGTTGVQGTVAGTLALSLAGAAPSFGSFAPGIGTTYSASVAATVTSTAAAAALTVQDTGSQAPGHLINGSYVLPSGLGVAAYDSNGAAGSGVYWDLSATNPATLLSFAGPTSNEPVTIAFEQHVAAGDPLRTGTYSKTLTFTLSTSSL